jgi:hypothetical protein
MAQHGHHERPHADAGEAEELASVHDGHDTRTERSPTAELLPAERDALVARQPFHGETAALGERGFDVAAGDRLGSGRRIPAAVSAMRFLLDHDVPDDIAHVLVALGHDVRKLRDVTKANALDDEVWRLAGEHESVLITFSPDDFLLLAGDTFRRDLKRRVPTLGLGRRRRIEERSLVHPSALLRLRHKADC